MPKNAGGVSRQSNRRPNNRILRALPAADFQRLLPDLKTIAATAALVFHKRGDSIEHVYFPNGGLASVTAELSDGTKVEAVSVGKEGMVGLEAFLGQQPVASGQTMMQVAHATVEQLSVVAFRRELARQGELYEIMGRYAQATVAQMMQSMVCNTLHQIPQRCCRWLLMTHDKVGRDDFTLSHRFLAMMLGVRRQSVTVVAGTLQNAGLLTYRRGNVKILNRKGLEKASCECYRPFGSSTQPNGPTPKLPPLRQTRHAKHSASQL